MFDKWVDVSESSWLFNCPVANLKKPTDGLALEKFLLAKGLPALLARWEVSQFFSGLAPGIVYRDFLKNGIILLAHGLTLFSHGKSPMFREDTQSGSRLKMFPYTCGTTHSSSSWGILGVPLFSRTRMLNAIAGLSV